MTEVVDVVIVGGGPAGLSAALVLGRGRKRVVVFDAGEPRNASASHVHGFVTRDGIPPREMRAAAHREIAQYPTIERRQERVTAIERVGVAATSASSTASGVASSTASGVASSASSASIVASGVASIVASGVASGVASSASSTSGVASSASSTSGVASITESGAASSVASMREGRFVVKTEGGEVRARRVLLCVGVVDEVPAMPGYRELWGSCVFQCPYCHAWEVRDRRFGYVPRDANAETSFALLLRGWTKDLVVFTGGTCELVGEHRRALEHAGIRIDERPMRGLRIEDERLAAVQLVDGSEVARDVLFVHPPQCQTELVTSLGLRCKEADIEIDDQYETSIAGIHAAGDLTTSLDSAIFAAAAGAAAAYKINAALTKELLAAGML